MKLTNVARASLNDELLKDYKSFLMQNAFRVWHRDSPEALAMRERLKHDFAPDLPPAKPGRPVLTGLAGLSAFIREAGPELAANAMLGAVNQAAYLDCRGIIDIPSDESDRSDQSDSSAIPGKHPCPPNATPSSRSPSTPCSPG